MNDSYRIQARIPDELYEKVLKRLRQRQMKGFEGNISQYLRWLIDEDVNGGK